MQRPNGKNWLIQVLSLQENPNSHQFCGLTAICRKTSFRWRLTMILPRPARITSCLAWSKVVYSSAPQFFVIWQLTKCPRGYKRWWILRHLPLDLGARPKGEQIKWSHVSLISVSRFAVIWLSRSFFSVLGLFVADGKLPLMIFYLGPQYPSLALRRIMQIIVSQ